MIASSCEKSFVQMNVGGTVSSFFRGLDNGENGSVAVPYLCLSVPFLKKNYTFRLFIFNAACKYRQLV